MAAAREAPQEHRTLVLTLAYSGCRLSEALALRTSHVDVEGKRLIFESLKKRRRGVYRAVPMPAEVVEAIDLVHGIREAKGTAKTELLWNMAGQRHGGWCAV